MESRFDSAATVRLDGLQNLTTGLGVAGTDPTLEYQVTAFYPLLQQTQSRWVRQFKLCQKVVQIIPDTMTESWGTFTLGGESGKKELVEWVNQKLWHLEGRRSFVELHGIQHGFNSAQTAANQTGNGAIVLLIDDGGNLSDPVELKRIKAVTGFTVFDRWQLQPDLSDFYAKGELTHFQLITSTMGRIVDVRGNPVSLQTRIHRDRVLWFRGQEILDDWELRANFGCDDSVLDSFVRAFTDYYASIRGMARMAVDPDVRVHKISGLLTGIESGGRQAEDLYASRVRQFHQQISLYRTGIIDKDLEEIDSVTRSLGGLDQISGKLLDWCLSNTDLFPSELLGQQLNRSGLADTGKTEQENANRRTRRFQAKKFDSNIRKLIKYLLLSKESPTQEEPDSWGWQWNPLYSTTPLEQSELELNRSQIASAIAAIDPTGTLAAAFILSNYGGEQYNPTVTLPKEAVRALEAVIKNPQQGQPREEGEAPAEGKEVPPEEGGEDVKVDPKAVQQAAEALGLDPAELAGYLGVKLDSRTDSIRQPVSKTPVKPEKATETAKHLSPEAKKKEVVDRNAKKESEKPKTKPVNHTDLIAKGDSLPDGVPDKYSHINFVPPLAVRKAFKRGLAAFEKHGGKGLVESATIREARAIARGEAVTPEKVDKGWRWFERNGDRFSKFPAESPAYVSFGLWGYSEGRKFFNDLKRQIQLADNKAQMDAVQDRDEGDRAAKADAFPIYKKRVELRPGVIAGITHLANQDFRHGTMMSADYGHIIGTKGFGGERNSSIDIYLGNKPESDRLFKVWQTTKQGEFDEYKYIAHCNDLDEARALYLRHCPLSMFGMIAVADWNELTSSRRSP
ncbi:MAG: anti-CBASS protein Acb1 family protein [Leptodesmis sp.]